MAENKKPFRRFSKRSKPQTIEDRIKGFILRNSKNGFYTRASTISYKFNVSDEQSWEIVGALLVEGGIEAVHDERTGEMKLCETGKTYQILSKESKRKRQKSNGTRKNKPKKAKPIP
ncbi:hypothetical protein NsoK4_04515 [Nitrosopumilus sp. K4]|uniref:hypothetical protein n=1 Tax=Nitrosopumilus sp. K4 TaxID=2795383 RepID=UPI001BA4D371|nr:hypothetical protein [Nitrosopumilus sp. K4]QUC65505.1 hypothetical protein NsoK4_04515 [Nitrosopumilus sp. K4]